jgi:zinc transporter 1
VITRADWRLVIEKLTRCVCVCVHLYIDGFHNLSDVVAIGIAYWALTTADKKASDSMSYGWRRSEIVGALVNGMFLLSLCLYVVLECIPRFIKPPGTSPTSARCTSDQPTSDRFFF